MSLPTPLKLIVLAEPLGRGVYEARPIGTVVGHTNAGVVSMECELVQTVNSSHEASEGSAMTLGLGVHFTTRNAESPRLYQIDLVSLCEAVVDAYIASHPDDVVETQT